METLTPTGKKLLNVTLLEPRLKHATIFQWFDALDESDEFIILNDHDPKPLYYQMLAERGNTFSFEYLENGPMWWRVKIRKNDAGNDVTVGEIVAKDIRKATLLKQLGIDFCCGGKKTLQQACREKNLNYDVVQLELQDTPVAAGDKNNYNEWSPDFLSDYIYNQHHQYYYNNADLISELTGKVVFKHGDSHPGLVQLQQAVVQLQQELKHHFMKEERVLFPVIKQMAQAVRTNDTGNFSIPDVEEAIKVMEADHDMAGELLGYIETLTNGFTPPGNACNSFKLLYAKLYDLKEDLHIHVHLENNILFPKTKDLLHKFNELKAALAVEA